MISLDTETTGIDFAHGTRAYFVTTADGSGKQAWWEWEVDPYTRTPSVPEADLDDIRHLLGKGQPLVLQNAKFDFMALDYAGFWRGEEEAEAWPRVFDTLLAAHLLASSHEHDLTALGVEYLGVDISRYEKRLKDICDQARRWCRTRLKDWAIAKKDLEIGGRKVMPSAGESCWKADTWLPMALVRHYGGTDKLSNATGKDCRDWETAAADYANADSAVTASLYPVMSARIKQRGLERIWEERRKSGYLARGLEKRGVTVSVASLQEHAGRFQQESDRAGAVMVGMAEALGAELKLPKGASVNGSLRSFMFDVLQCPQMRGKKAKTDTPTLEADALRSFLNHFPAHSVGLAFIETLIGKRSCDAALGFMRAYQRFWVGEEEMAYRLLHPHTNPTGTGTLRWSCKNPNEQNISKKEDYNVRACFGPAPGREWWSLDAKNIELRIPAYASGEESLIYLFERPDDPPYYGSNHLMIFHLLWPDLWAEGERAVGYEKAGAWCKKKYEATFYKWVKNGNFAVQYGAIERASGEGTADKAYRQPGAHAKVKSKLVALEAYNKAAIKEAERKGYVETIPDRSVDPTRGYPLVCTRTDYGRILPTVPLNYKVQGTAMWWMCRAMDRCGTQLEEWRRRDRFDAWMTLQVHDELVFDMPKAACPFTDPKRSNLRRVKILKALMEQGGIDIGVPTPVGCEYNEVSWDKGRVAA